MSVRKLIVIAVCLYWASVLAATVAAYAHSRYMRSFVGGEPRPNLTWGDPVFHALPAEWRREIMEKLDSRLPPSM
jgi:hypothetical protein